MGADEGEEGEIVGKGKEDETREDRKSEGGRKDGISVAEAEEEDRMGGEAE